MHQDALASCYDRGGSTTFWLSDVCRLQFLTLIGTFYRSSCIEFLFISYFETAKYCVQKIDFKLSHPIGYGSDLKINGYIREKSIQREIQYVYLKNKFLIPAAK